MKRLIFLTAALTLLAAVSCTKDEPSNQFADTVWMKQTELDGVPGFEAYRFHEDMTYMHWFEDETGHVLQWYDSGYYEDRPDYSVIALDYKTTHNPFASSGNPPVVFLYNSDPAQKFYRQNP